MTGSTTLLTAFAALLVLAAVPAYRGFDLSGAVEIAGRHRARSLEM